MFISSLIIYRFISVNSNFSYFSQLMNCFSDIFKFKSLGFSLSTMRSAYRDASHKDKESLARWPLAFYMVRFRSRLRGEFNT